jgi:hypothetical protein
LFTINGVIPMSTNKLGIHDMLLFMLFHVHL